MVYIRDVLFNTRKPLVPEDIEKVREASLQANLLSLDRMANTINDTLIEHRKLQNQAKEKRDGSGN